MTSKGKTSGFIHPGVFLFWAVITVSSIGCTTVDHSQRQPPDARYPVSYYIQGIPFFPQEEFQCGPAVLASVLSFFGYRTVPENISKAIYLEGIQGTITMDMGRFVARYAGDGRISVSELQGDLEVIRRDVSRGYPVIVFVDLGIWNIRKGHYMLIVGYDDVRGGIITYSGVERDKLIPYTRFMRTWERGGYWALRIIPG